MIPNGFNTSFILLLANFVPIQVVYFIFLSSISDSTYSVAIYNFSTFLLQNAAF